jgi:hypothetical protein
MEGICQVSFTKVKDNTNRVLLCTLDPSKLPAKFLKSVEAIDKPVEDEDRLPVWDVSENKWKSFRISKVNSFRTEDELTKQDKTGPDTDSNQKQEIENRRKTAKQKFNEQVQKQKEQAQKSKQNLEQARTIINKLRGT